MSKDRDPVEQDVYIGFSPPIRDLSSEQKILLLLRGASSAPNLFGMKNQRGTLKNFKHLEVTKNDFF